MAEYDIRLTKDQVEGLLTKKVRPWLFYFTESDHCSG